MFFPESGIITSIVADVVMLLLDWNALLCCANHKYIAAVHVKQYL